MDERNAYALMALYLASLAFYVWAVDRIKNGYALMALYLASLAFYVWAVDRIKNGRG